MRVLICDDEPSIRMLFRTAAERSGAEVVEAADGQACVEVASRQAPDLIILDVVMPKRDGWSTLPALRRVCPDTTVILTSANASEELIAQGRLWGASDCVDKLHLLPMIPQLVQRAAVRI